MNQLWRRNIRKAAGAGVEVTVGDDLKAFHDLYVHTAGRDRFTPRPLRYFETMFAAMSAEDPGRIRLYLARHQGDPVAAAILVRSAPAPGTPTAPPRPRSARCAAPTPASGR